MLTKYKLHDEKEIDLADLRDFRLQTNGEKPWCAKNTKGEQVFLARCACCGNPVQLLGLIDKGVNSPRPHIRHLGRNIEAIKNYGLGEYVDWCALESCGYYHPDKIGPDTPRHNARSRVVTELLELIVQHFDALFDVLSRSSGLYFSVKKKLELLQSFVADGNYLYVGVNEANIPWLIALAMNVHLWGRRVYKNSDLYQKLSELEQISLPDAEEDPANLAKIEYDKTLELNLFGTHHVYADGAGRGQCLRLDAVLIKRGDGRGDERLGAFTLDLRIDPVGFGWNDVINGNAPGAVIERTDRQNIRDTINQARH